MKPLEPKSNKTKTKNKTETETKNREEPKNQNHPIPRTNLHILKISRLPRRTREVQPEGTHFINYPFAYFDSLFITKKVTTYVRPYVVSHPVGCELYPAILCHAQPDIT